MTNKDQPIPTGKKIKLWLVRRWVRELPEAELKDAYEWVRNMNLMNKAYGKLAESMINTFYTETSPPRKERNE